MNLTVPSGSQPAVWVLAAGGAHAIVTNANNTRHRMLVAPASTPRG
jgi:hypothetical protein